MNDQEFEKTMDTWAAQETASAPDMRPTPEMVRLVRAKRQRPASLFRPRWALAALAVTALAVLLYVILFRPVLLFHRSGIRQVAHIGQRAGPKDERDVVVRTPTLPGQGGPEKGAVSFAQFVLELDQAKAPHIIGIDLRAVQEETILLTPADNYRLRMEPAGTCHLYVFQHTSSGVLIKLFHAETYSTVQNPLRSGQRVYLPSEPNWLYVGEDKGRDRLYIVASAQPLHDLETMYEQYTQAGDISSRQETLDSLLARLDDIGTVRSQGASKWLIVLDHTVQN